MPEITAPAVRLDKPGNSLAAWLAYHHPDLFVAMFKQAQQAKAASAVRRNMGGLGDDTGLGDPNLESITFDPNSVGVSSSLLSPATDSGSSFLDTIGDGLTSAGSSVGSALASVGSGVLNGIASVGGFLTSAAGLNSLATVAKSYYGAQAANSTAQTQQAVLGAQIARAQTGQLAAPITYQRNAAGQLVPVYATQTPGGTVYTPLSQTGLASVTPSGFSVFLSQYGLYLAGGLALLAALMWRK